jgi:signal peptidase I
MLSFAWFELLWLGSVMRSFLTESLETLLLALVIFLLLQTSVQNFKVEGASMKPTLSEGEFVLVNKLSYIGFPVGEAATLLPSLPVQNDKVIFPFRQPSRGEVIVFRFPSNRARFFVKRVIGVPGDNLQLRDGYVIINGEQLEEPYLKNRGSRTMGPILVPENKYFVLGDNRNASNDSRDWEFIFIPRADVIGASWLTYEAPLPFGFLSPSSNLN